MGAVVQWLLSFSKTFITWLYNSFIDLINGAISGFATFAITLVSLIPTYTMPTPPSQPEGVSLSVIVQLLNWLLPMQYFVSLVVFFGTGVILYASLAPLLRWAKLWR